LFKRFNLLAVKTANNKDGDNLSREANQHKHRLQSIINLMSITNKRTFNNWLSK